MTEISTRDRAGEYDALETAKPDEPIFVVQGGDPFGPATVGYWAALQREAAMKADRRDDAVAGLRKASNAEEVAWEMREYQRGDAAPVEAKPKGYGGVDPDADRPVIARMSALADRIYNALAELSEVGDALAGIGGHAAAEMKLRDAVIAASEAVRLIEPRKHLPRADGPLRELDRVPDPEPEILETIKDRRIRLSQAVPSFKTRKAAIREAKELAAAEGASFVQIAGIAFTAEEVETMLDRMNGLPDPVEGVRG